MTLPNTWSFSLLKNVTVKIQDGNYGANYPKQEEFISTGIPFLTSKAINGSNKIDLAKINFSIFSISSGNQNFGPLTSQ